MCAQITIPINPTGEQSADVKLPDGWRVHTNGKGESSEVIDADGYVRAVLYHDPECVNVQ